MGNIPVTISIGSSCDQQIFEKFASFVTVILCGTQSMTVPAHRECVTGAKHTKYLTEVDPKHIHKFREKYYVQNYKYGGNDKL